MSFEVRPANVFTPKANYALGVVTDSPSRWLHTAGIVPVRPDGTVPDTIGEQAETIWATIAALLGEAQMTIANIVSLVTYVVAGERDRLGEVMAARDAALDGHRAASTLVTVHALVRPEWKVEISVVAAR